MTESNGSGRKPGSPEWQAWLDSEIRAYDARLMVTKSVRVFGEWLRTVWVADLESVPEPTMPALAVVAGGVV
jgi:hypothetical protein